MHTPQGVVPVLQPPWRRRRRGGAAYQREGGRGRDEWVYATRACSAAVDGWRLLQLWLRQRLRLLPLCPWLLFVLRLPPSPTAAPAAAPAAAAACATAAPLQRSAVCPPPSPPAASQRADSL